MAFLVHPLPPVNVYVKMEYLYDLEPGHPSWGNLTPGIWISVKSQRLDNDHPRDVLEALVANGGLDPESGVSGVDPQQESQS